MSELNSNRSHNVKRQRAASVSSISWLTFCCSQFLSDCVVGAPADPEGEVEVEEERGLSNRGGAAAFHVVGTVSDKCEEGRAQALQGYEVRAQPITSSQ